MHYGKHFVITARPLRIVALFCAVALCGVGRPQMSAAGVTLHEAPHSAGKQTTESQLDAAGRLRLAQSGSRSYLEGRDFQSYRQDRGFAGERNFGRYPDTRSGPRDQRPYSLKRRRLYGPGDNRCADWSRRCAQRTGDAPGDYQSCMRYHGCR